MVQLKAQRTALGLYAILLVLPTAVLGGLLWDQLVRDHHERVQNVPVHVEHATRRLVDRIEERSMGLMYSQDHESYYAYRDPHIDATARSGAAPLLRSNLQQSPRSEILLWFHYDFDAGPESPPSFVPGPGLTGLDSSDSSESEQLTRLAETLEGLIRFEFEEDDRLSVMRKSDVAPFMHPLLCTSAYAAGEEHLQEVLDYFEEHPELHEARSVILIYAFHLRFFRTPDTLEPRLLATRSIELEGSKELAAIPDLPEFLHRARDGYEEVQGFFIDPQWFFERMPLEEAGSVLGPDLSMQFLTPGAEDPRLQDEDFHHSDITLVKVAGLELYRGEQNPPGQLRVSGSTEELKTRFRRQKWRFFSMAGMLTISLGLGMVLLLRMVHRDLKQAERTENFVAAVTHELRTPLTAIRLYGEMLRDGWVDGGEKRADYYRRILRETGRLETLVERVLTKARLSSSEMKVVPGDLNEAVRESALAFSGHTPGDREDHEIELGADLPRVRLNPDAVTSVLTNLVENARKYAPPAPAVNGNPPGEPLHIETRLHENRVVLEVADRGPGIPAEELPNVFQAFYRIGTESTRKTKGTGLGLHLVAIQVESMGGQVEALPREGGGTLFRVTFANSEA